MNVLLVFLGALCVGVLVQIIIITIQDRQLARKYRKRTAELDAFYAEQKKQFDEIYKEQMP